MSQPIGIFDSGIGGLSVLKALRAELPNERFIYIADSGHAPYGERDDAHIIDRSLTIAAAVAVLQATTSALMFCLTRYAAIVKERPMTCASSLSPYGAWPLSAM